MSKNNIHTEKTNNIKIAISVPKRMRHMETEKFVEFHSFEIERFFEITV